MAHQFSVRLAPAFLKDLAKLPPAIRKETLKALTILEAEPFGPPPKYKKLKGKGIGQWRLRIGSYRIRYDVIHKDVVLYRVRHRKDIYRGT